MSKTPKRVLTIAGSDSGGGAGIQADLKTYSALGCFGTSAITAITAQNTVGVTAIHPVPPDVIVAQIKAVVEDIGTDAVKIGMLHDSDVIRAVARTLAEHDLKNIVLDPVMVATSGDRLLQDSAITSLIQELIPLADVITPNIPEAEILLGRKLEHQADLPEAARELARLGCRSVLLKAGHLSEKRLVDIFHFAEDDQIVELVSQRLETPNTHGTGCTLSSAMAAYLARGESLTEAARLAKDYITQAIVAGSEYRIGQGHGPVHHFHALWKRQ